MGDQYVYADTFQDALGILALELKTAGAELVGQWSSNGYDFIASRGCITGKFVGLALDDDNQAKQTPERIKHWVNQIIREMDLKQLLVTN